MKLFSKNPNICKRKKCDGKTHTNRDEINPKCKDCENYILLTCCCHYENCQTCSVNDINNVQDIL